MSLKSDMLGRSWPSFPNGFYVQLSVLLYLRNCRSPRTLASRGTALWALERHAQAGSLISIWVPFR